MKSKNIIKKLEKQGFKISYKKWAYWDNIPHIEMEKFSFAIAEMRGGIGGNSLSLNLDFVFNEVLNAISTSQWINKKLDESKNYYYNMYKILSMQDYYNYKKNLYPYRELWHILQKINRTC